jgi:CBS-domain-containing membrane protein
MKKKNIFDILSLDTKFKTHYPQYIFQCVLATLTILAILIFLDVLKEAALITALGASALITFTTPHQYSSDPRRLLGGYMVGLMVGFILFFIAHHQIVHGLFANQTTPLILFGSIAVGFSIFIMTITNTEHAPAAGIALGLVINSWDWLTIVYIIIAIIWLACIKIILKKYLMDLISPHVFLSASKN